jgi:hypothetical protein
MRILRPRWSEGRVAAPSQAGGSGSGAGGTLGKILSG